MALRKHSENIKQNKLAPLIYETGHEERIAIDPENEIVTISNCSRPHDRVEILFKDFQNIFKTFETALFDHTMDLSPNPRDPPFDPDDPQWEIYFKNRRGPKMLQELTWTVIPNTQENAEEEYRFFKYGKDDVELQIVPLTPRKLRPRKDSNFFPIRLDEYDYHILAQIDKYIQRHPISLSCSSLDTDSSVSSMPLATNEKECDLCESSEESSEFETDTSDTDSEYSDRELPSILGRMAMAAKSLVKVLDSKPPPRKRRKLHKTA